MTSLHSLVILWLMNYTKIDCVRMQSERQIIMNKKKFPILSIILYVLAGLLMIFAIWSSSQSIGYISEMINQGQLVFGGNEFDIINFIMSSCAQYVIFAVILIALGCILQKLQFCTSSVSTKEVIESPIESSEDLSDDNTTEDVIEE